jgi:hypothetical protein
LVQLRGRGDDALTDCLPRLGGGDYRVSTGSDHGLWRKTTGFGLVMSQKPNMVGPAMGKEKE